MILQSSLESQIDNLVTLIGTNSINDARSLKSFSSMQVAYRLFIERLQKRKLDGKSGLANIISDAKKANVLRPLFINDSLLYDKQQNEVIAVEEDGHRHEKSNLIRSAQKTLQSYVRNILLFLIQLSPIFLYCLQPLQKKDQHRRQSALCGPIHILTMPFMMSWKCYCMNSLTIHFLLMNFAIVTTTTPR
jgi:hypothetical protein